MTLINNDSKLIRIFIGSFILLSSILYFNYQFASATKSQDTMVLQLDQLLDEAPILKGAIAGVSVRSATTGELLFNHFGDIRLKPASNIKLLTAAASMSVLGEDYRFSTEVLTDGFLINGSLFGNLYVKGKGDPTLLKENLIKMASELKEKGISTIRGDLIADDTWFDDIRLSKDLSWSNESAYYGAQVSALTISPNQDFDAGTIIVEVRPGSELGDIPVVKLTPASNFVRIDNYAKTSAKGEKNELTIERKHGTNTITIEGTIPKGPAMTREWVAIWEPTLYTMELFKETLLEQGIFLLGKASVGTTPRYVETLSVHTSMPLSELLLSFMKFSNNGHGEILVKEMGRFVYGEGSWENGLNVVSNELINMGIDSSNMVLRDGSGMSHVNLVAANDISQLLYEIQDEKWFPTYKNSLPIAGATDRLLGGTLWYRMTSLPKNVEVRAKTGTISTVSALSGYITTSTGNSYTFSIILNNLLDVKKGKQLEDKLVTILANQ